MESDDRLDWVTRFDDPVVLDAQRRKQSRALALVGGILGGGGAVAAIALLVAALSRPATEESGSGPPPAPTVLPSASPTVEAEPSLLPSGCDGLYSEAMIVTLNGIGMTLGTGWEGEHHSGSADAELRALLGATELDCHWSDAQGAALLTRVAEVDAETQTAAIARLEALGFTRLDELGGIRYFIERTNATGASGESHLLRDGLWFATHWRAHGQYGYTADMATSVFG